VKKGLHKKIKEEGLLISLSTSSKPSMKNRLHKIIKEKGHLISLSTSSKPGVKKGLHMIIKEEGLLFSLSTRSKTKYEERTSQENQRGRPLDFFVDQF
jgi:hypothetical protein